MSNYKEQLQQNNNELNAILETVNSLPEAGGGGGSNELLKKVVSRSEAFSITATDLQGATSIGRWAFYYCDRITGIAIPNSVVTIGNSAFDGCYGLTSVVIGNSVTSIGDSAFDGCSSLTSVTIGDSVTSMGDSVFRNCNRLTSIVIPDRVMSIGNSAFSGCRGLTSVEMGDSITSIGSFAFQSCTSLTSIEIPDNVTSIDNNAFSNCSGLTSVTIGNSVISIGEYAFAGCDTMKIYDFTSHTSVPTLSNEGVFSNIPSDCVIRVPAALYNEWIAATNWSVYANYIEDEFGNRDPNIDGDDDNGSNEVIEFTINGFKANYSCQALKGMTWTKWCDSEYNIANLYVEDNIITDGLMYLSDGDYEEVSPYETIIADYTYDLVM